ncbi:DUF1702 family protein [Saccharomonospora amisosensis]
MADFDRRGFRTDRPHQRELLERHARYFLTGFNIAVRHWRNPHSTLAELPPEERGFAYEGAAMHAALRDMFSFGRARAFARLSAGRGNRYIHLIHVGYGWALAPARLSLPTLVPDTPLLRWLALDGAGFADTFFGGLATLYRCCQRGPTPRSSVRIAGCGRALWFVQSGDVAGVTRAIAQAPEPARPDLWSGIGLAMCYAGGADEEALEELVRASGPARGHLGQGALFAIAARFRSGIVPEYTEKACRKLFSVTPEEVSKWTDDAASGLFEVAELSGYTEWKSRLRVVAVQKL